MLKEVFSKLVHTWKVLFSDRAFKISLYVGLFMLIMAYVVTYLASFYNDSQTYLSVGDLILDNIDTYDLEFIFTWVMYALIFMCFAYPALFKPEIVPFALKTYALLLFLRSGFILLTNIGPPVGFFYSGTQVGGQPLSDLLFKNDLFFSGHTAFPFLAFLIYRETKLRWMFLLGSIVEGITVLLMHVHYSIDVFAAFFITYGTYAASLAIFNRLNVRYSTRLKLYGWNTLKQLKIFKSNN